MYPISINDVKRKSLRIKKVQIFEKNRSVIVYLQVNKNKMVSTSFIMKLNFVGELDYLVPLDLHDDENIISISGLYQDLNSFIFTGTYSTKKVEKLTEGLFFIHLMDKKIATKN